MSFELALSVPVIVRKLPAAATAPPVPVGKVGEGRIGKTGETVSFFAALNGAGFYIVRETNRPMILGVPSPARQPILAVEAPDIIGSVMERMSADAGDPRSPVGAYLDASLCRFICGLLDARWWKRERDFLTEDKGQPDENALWLHAIVRVNNEDRTIGDLLDQAAGRESAYAISRRRASDGG